MRDEKRFLKLASWNHMKLKQFSKIYLGWIFTSHEYQEYVESHLHIAIASDEFIVVDLRCGKGKNQVWTFS